VRARACGRAAARRPLPAPPAARARVARARGGGLSAGLEDAAGGEGGLDGLRGLGAVELLRRRDGAPREIRHRGAGEVELALEDDRVGLNVPERAADVPQRPRPDPAVVVYLAVEVTGVVEVVVDAPEAVRNLDRVRGRVPV